MTEGTIMFSVKKISKSFRILLSRAQSLTDIVDAMISLVHERCNHDESCITVELSRGMQKYENYLAIGRSGFAFFRTDLGHSLESSVSDQFGVMLRGERPQKREFAYNIVRIQLPLIYTDLI